MFTETGVLEGQEAFICYGLHPNSFLLLEYGFVLNDNPNNAVYLDQSKLNPYSAPWKLSNAVQVI